MTTGRIEKFVSGIRAAATVGALAVAGVFVLFMLEAAPLKSTTDTASAWHCKSMTATPATIVRGESTKLAWSFGAPEAGVYVTLEPGGERFEGTQGAKTVSPTETTTYTATARKPNTHTTFTCSVKVTVTVPPAPVCAMSAAPASIEAGQSSVLSWEGTNVSSVTVDQGIGAVETKGTKSVSPATTTTYTGTFTGTDGSTISCHTTITVTPPAVSACELTALPTSLKKKEQTTLTWKGTNVQSVSIDQGIGTVDASGSRSIEIATTTVFTGTFAGKDGVTRTCTATVTVTEDPAPLCTLTADPTRVRAGETATLRWSSERAVSATIDQGVGAVATTGTTSVAVTSNTTYTGTFTASDGRTVTCSAPVSVETIVSGSSSSGGGGGRCLNCGGSSSRPPERRPPVTDDPTPTPTVLLSKVVTNAGGFITLDQVPYTGFTAGPVLTTLFWLAILGLSALIAYVLTVTRPFARMRSALESGPQVSHREAPAGQHRTVDAHTLTAPAAPLYTPLTFMDTQSREETPSYESIIEERAHREYILLSPEALRSIRTELERSNGDVQATLSSIFERAKSLYPREDGWILLSKERATGLLVPTAEHEERATAAPIAGPLHDVETRNTRGDISLARGTHSAPTATPRMAVAAAHEVSRATPEANQIPEAVSEAVFLGFLARGEEQQAYSFLRTLVTSGTAEQFIASLVRKLDDVYKHRLEGNRTPDAELARATAAWSNADFETVLGMLVECIDYSYASNRVGTKVALAKVFAHFKRA